MLCGMPVAQVEEALSSALTDSLRVPASQRPAFIANRLVAGTSDAAALPDAPQTRPPELDAEIEALNRLVRDAVNCAARHSDQPLQRIADYILRLQPDGAGLALEGDELQQHMPQLEPIAEASASRSPVPALTPAAVRKAAITGKTENPVIQAIAARRKEKIVPLLGKTASTVLPAVIGAFEEEAAKRIARTIDEDVIAEAMKAGSKAKGMDEEGAPE